jgi:uncharacterized membrane protein
MYNKSKPVKALSFFRSIPDIHMLLIFSCCFSLGLTIFRIIYSGQFMFAWLNWNLFLAFVPYFLSSLMIRKPGIRENKVKFVILFFSWLVFIPNTFYIITDLFHLQERMPVPLWFDLALIISFVWNGILLGILSIGQMEKIMKLKFQWMNNWIFILCIMWLNAFGVYVGRYLRYNSWDVLTNPFELVGDLFYLVIHPIRNRYDWSMVICYTVLMTMIYLGFKTRHAFEEGKIHFSERGKN